MNEVRLRFWEQLRLTNPELFNGAPARQHFYNLVHRECLPFRIRLNIYCTRHYYENNGFLTVRVLTAGNQIGNLSRQLAIINQGIIIEPHRLSTTHRLRHHLPEFRPCLSDRRGRFELGNGERLVQKECKHACERIERAGEERINQLSTLVNRK